MIGFFLNFYLKVKIKHPPPPPPPELEPSEEDVSPPPGGGGGNVAITELINTNKTNPNTHNTLYFIIIVSITKYYKL